MFEISRRATALLMLASLMAVACSPTGQSTPIPHSPEVATVSTDRAQLINEAADAWIASGKALGVAVEISRGGEVVFARGFGPANLGSSAPVTPSTVFRIGSVSKQFTAAAILQLVQADKISLDDKLSAYLPNFPRGDEVTVHQLLNHTSGIHNYMEFGMNPLAVRALMTDHTTDEWVDYIAHQSPLYDFAPGSAWHYTNSGFFLAGAIVEKVSGEPLSTYLHDNIFSPLGMSQTAVDGNSDTGEGRARGYDPAWLPGRGFRRPIYVSMSVPGGAGALRSSADDLITWSNALFAGKVVDPSLLDTMLTPGRLADGRLASSNRVDMDPSEPGGEYGLGIRIGQHNGHREFGHEGDIPGFNAALYTYPDADQLMVAVIANTPGGANDLARQIARIMLE